MRFFDRLALYFFVLLMSTISGVIILFVTHMLTLDEIIYYLDLVYHNDQLRLAVGSISGALIILVLLLQKAIIGSKQKERTIAFDNPAGRVSISLTAVEDLVKRLIYRESEVKEVRPSVLATKKGIEIAARLVLKAEVNIPDMTARLQGRIKDKIQETLGVEEPVIVRIHVMKMISEQTKHKQTKEQEKPGPEDVTVPFQGYRN